MNFLLWGFTILQLTINKIRESLKERLRDNFADLLFRSMELPCNIIKIFITVTMCQLDKHNQYLNWRILFILLSSVASCAMGAQLHPIVVLFNQRRADSLSPSLPSVYLASFHPSAGLSPVFFLTYPSFPHWAWKANPRMRYTKLHKGFTRVTKHRIGQLYLLSGCCFYGIIKIHQIK